MRRHARTRLFFGRFLFGRFFAPGAERKYISARGDRIPFGSHFLGSIGIFVDEIVHFAAVGGHIVEFPALILFGDEFPFAVAKSAISFVLPENGLLAIE